eukprot:TRINITY_DN2653_c0_g1_i5.p1 TRINITY_DN2653_c0_g1~~TRINITY_DN2653_c0_g1_i5.p1  ORF type:complete len:288 (-),score=60.10 TRINITY_DN2653_c0_g1_i5:21-821(-)
MACTEGTLLQPTKPIYFKTLYPFYNPKMYRQQNIVSLRHNATRPINAFSVQRRSPTVITNFFKPYQSSNGSPQKQEKVQEEEQVAIPEVDAKNVLHMAPDTLTAYRQAQANMQQLNNSRIIAVEELKSARKKIKELEVKLKEAEERAKTALQQNTQQVTSSSVTVQEAETVFSFEEEQEVDQISTDQGLLVDEEEVKEEEEVVQPENVVVEEEQEVVVQPENVVAEEEIEQEEEEEQVAEEEEQQDRKSTRLNSSHEIPSRMPSSA